MSMRTNVPDYRVSTGVGAPREYGTKSSTSPPPRKIAEVFYTPKSLKLGGKLAKSLRRKGFSVEQAAMIAVNADHYLRPSRPRPNYVVMVVGTATDAYCPQEWADEAVRLAREGSQVLVIILNRLDKEQVGLSIENRKCFSELSSYWAGADRTGWEDNLVVFQAGGPLEAQQSVERWEARVDNAPQRSLQSTFKGRSEAREKLPVIKRMLEDLEKGQVLRLTASVKQPDRISITQRATRQGAGQFSFERIEITVLDAEAVGFISGSFVEGVTAEEVLRFCDLMQATFELSGPVVPHVGPDATTRARFATGLFASKRELVIKNLPDVPGRLDTVTRTVSGGAGANVTALRLEPGSNGRTATSDLFLILEVGWIPIDHRVELLKSLRRLRGYEKVCIYHHSGALNEEEVPFLDRRSVTRTKRRRQRRS